MIRMMRRGLAMAVTVDGPQGPPYKAKKGAVLLAKKTSNPMMPFVVETAKYWTLRSWDRLQIPKPFTRAKLIIGKPIFVAPDADEIEIERKRLELQKALDELVATGEKWRKSTNNV